MAAATATATRKARPAGKAPDYLGRIRGEGAAAVERFSDGPTCRELHEIARDMRTLSARVRAFLDDPSQTRAVRLGRGAKAAAYLREDLGAFAYNLEFFLSTIDCQLVGDPLGELAEFIRGLS